MAVQGKMIGIIGGDTYKHFRKSMVSFTTVSKIQTAGIPRCLERKALNGILQNAQRQCYTAVSKSEPYKNAATQTDYRESEAQTEPWEPPCKIIPGNNNYIAVMLQYNEIRRNQLENRKGKKETKLEMQKSENSNEDILIFI